MLHCAWWSLGSEDLFFGELSHDLKSELPPSKQHSKEWGDRSEDIYQIKHPLRPTVAHGIWQLGHPHFGSDLLFVLLLTLLLTITSTLASLRSSFPGLQPQPLRHQELCWVVGVQYYCENNLINYVGLSMVTGHIHMHSLIWSSPQYEEFGRTVSIFSQFT